MDIKLSEIINLARTLDGFKAADVSTRLDHEIAPWIHTVEHGVCRDDALLSQMHSQHQLLRSNVSGMADLWQKYRAHLDRIINERSTEYFHLSYEIYQCELTRLDHSEHVLGRRLPLDPDQLEYILARILPFGDWHHAAMVLRPGLEPWLDNLVAADPLYVIDQSWELLKPVEKRYTPAFQRRLRKYVIDEQRATDILYQIPDGQFGFCLAYNFFHQKPFDIVGRYLEETLRKLRPGGVFAFTVNDCDRPGGVDLVERAFACYTPVSMLVALADRLGYDINRINHLDANTSWIELRKPGQSCSLRGGQMLSKPVDRRGVPKYTSEKKRALEERKLARQRELQQQEQEQWQQQQRERLAREQAERDAAAAQIQAMLEQERQQAEARMKAAEEVRQHSIRRTAKIKGVANWDTGTIEQLEQELQRLAERERRAKLERWAHNNGISDYEHLDNQELESMIHEKQAREKRQNYEQLAQNLGLENFADLNMDDLQHLVDSTQAKIWAERNQREELARQNHERNIRDLGRELAVQGWDTRDIKDLEPEVTRAETRHLRELAIEWNLDEPSRIRYGYSLDKLRAVVKAYRAAKESK